MIEPLDPDIICVWPLRKPPTRRDLNRIASLAQLVQCQLTETEVLAIIEPEGRA